MDWKTKLSELRFEALRRTFGFDRRHSWRASAGSLAGVADLVCSLKPHSVAEIDCGLGDLLASFGVPSATGFDADGGVVAAARFLHGRKARFFHASVAEPESIVRLLTRSGVESLDLLLMIDRTLDGTPEKIARSVAILHSQVPIRYVLTDAFDPDRSDYRLGEAVQSVSLDQQRKAHLFSLASFEMNQLSTLQFAIESVAPSPRPV